MWQLLPPAALLLLVSPCMRADLPTSRVVLDPPYNRVLKDDTVILKCLGNDPFGNSSTQWFHNGSLISTKSSSYFLTVASVNDSGEYKCQNSLSSLSDPVHLAVHTDWLLLQATQWIFQVGKPIQLRCHSWKDMKVYKVSYLQNGKVRKYCKENFDFHISEANHKDNGSYFCRGLIKGTKNVSSAAVNIFVEGEAKPAQLIQPFFIPWQIIFFLVVGFLFAVDTGLYFFVWRDLRSSVGNGRDINVRAKTLMTNDP